MSRFLRRLGAGFRLILFDRRGTGLSERVPDDELPSLEGRMDDARAVLDAAGSEQAAVFAQGYGCPLAIVFAASYPERTRALILYNAIAKAGLSTDDYPGARRHRKRKRGARNPGGAGEARNSHVSGCGGSRRAQPATLMRSPGMHA